MLSKTDLQSFLQCPRKLWLERHRPELAEAEDSRSRRREIDGNIVGEKARAQLGPDFIWPPARDDHAQAAEEAKSLLGQSPQLSAVEVPMFYGGLYARADALVSEKGNREKDGYVLRETKASNFPLKKDKATPDKPEEHHLIDIAIQAWVMGKSGLAMTRGELNFLNGRWRYPGDGDFSGLFRSMEVTQEIESRIALVPSWLTEAEQILAGQMPEITTGKQCHKPYDCPFFKYCLKLDPPSEEHPIELLPGNPGKSLAKKLHAAKGYVSLLEPTPDELSGKEADLYRRMQKAHRTGQAILEPDSINILKEFPYPRYYFDFEGIDLAVPRWPGVRPYEHIPFQWSCHTERAPGVFEHDEFLDLTGDDPSIQCIERMRGIIDPDDRGPIFVYHAIYERDRLEELAERHPIYAGLAQKYINRLIDLLPIVRQKLYHPSMRGSFSIKKVLPAIVPDLNYDHLKGIHEGTGAQVAYIEAALNYETSPKRKAQIEQQLRLYCGLDTWALVEVAYYLAQTGRPHRPGGA